MTRTLRSRDEAGVSAILVSSLMVALVGILAFVTDFGLAYVNQRGLQNGVDAAALAVAEEVAQASHTLDCAATAAAYDTATMRDLAAEYFDGNAHPDGDLLPSSTGFDVTCETVGGVSRVVVTVKSGQESPAIFGGGVVPVSKSAKAIVGPPGTVVGLRPFAICEDSVDDIVHAVPGTTFIQELDNADFGCGSGAGNWGLLDFNGGSNPTGEMKDWIKNGFNGPISLETPLPIFGDPGFNVNAAIDEMNYMMALSDIVLPVYRSMSGNGNNTKFEVIGFVSVTPCRYAINNKSGPDEAEVNDGCGPLPTSPPDDFIQLMYSDWIPISEISLTCDFADPTCDKGPRTFALAD
jgi:Flp pilus assembly protein TadG